MSDIEPIQLSFPWWVDTIYWKDDDTPDVIETVDRPTEDEALRNLLLQSKVIERNGRMLNLTALHMIVLRLERTCLRDYPHYPDAALFISERSMFAPKQARALLDEASGIIYVRALMGLPEIRIEHEPVIVRLAA